jgi:hypothetical protein
MLRLSLPLMQHTPLKYTWTGSLADGSSLLMDTG